ARGQRVPHPPRQAASCERRTRTDPLRRARGAPDDARDGSTSREASAPGFGASGAMSRGSSESPQTHFSRRARISFLGDTLIGGEAQPVLDDKGPDWAFDGIRELLASSDLVVANLEGPITSRDDPEAKSDNGRKRYWYRAQPESVNALLKVGV